MCSSWVSHLPPEVEYEEVVGHGMNVEELGRNPRLNRFFVRNLNESPGFTAPDKQFDAVLCCVSGRVFCFFLFLHNILVKTQRALAHCYFLHRLSSS